MSQMKNRSVRFHGLLMLLVFGIMGLAALPADAQPKPTVRHWVQQLGSDSFAEREEAYAKLLGLGNKGLPDLQSEQQSQDVETQLRIQELIKQITSTDQAAKIEHFINSDGLTITLPGWNSYRALLGNGKEQRTSFAELYQHRQDWSKQLEDVNQPKKLLDDWVAEARAQFVFNPDEYSIQTTDLMILLAGTIPKAKNLDAEPLIQFMALTTLHPNIQQQYKKRSMSRALQIAFLSSDESESKTELLVKMIGRLKLNEELPLLWAIAEAKTNSGELRAHAILQLAKQSPQLATRRLPDLTNDKTPLGTRTFRGKQIHTQLRDVVLAVLLKLRKEELGPYDFPYHKNIPGRIFHSAPNTFGFYSDEQRRQAFAKWEQRQAP